MPKSKKRKRLEALRNGFILECKTYNIVKNALKSDENCFMDVRGKDDIYGGYQIDVLFKLDGKLYIIECKYRRYCKDKSKAVIWLPSGESGNNLWMGKEKVSGWIYSLKNKAKAFRSHKLYQHLFGNKDVEIEYILVVDSLLRVSNSSVFYAHCGIVKIVHISFFKKYLAFYT